MHSISPSSFSIVWIFSFISSISLQNSLFSLRFIPMSSAIPSLYFSVYSFIKRFLVFLSLSIFRELTGLSIFGLLADFGLPLFRGIFKTTDSADVSFTDTSSQVLFISDDTVSDTQSCAGLSTAVSEGSYPPSVSLPPAVCPLSE